MDYLLILFVIIIVVVIIVIIGFVIKISLYFKNQPRQTCVAERENFYTTYPKFDDTTKARLQTHEYNYYDNPRARQIIYGLRHRGNPGYNHGPYYVGSHRY